jgi:hypothetical protein
MNRIFQILFGSPHPSPAPRRRPKPRPNRHQQPKQPKWPKRPKKSSAKVRGQGGKVVNRVKQPSKPQSARAGVIVYHGTPTLEGARSIVRHGWIVGNGNAMGDGIYLSTSEQTARTYASASGFLIKAKLVPDRCATWSPELGQAFTTWCRQRNCPPDNSARTAFLLERRYTTLKQGDVYVVLQRGYRNPAATKIRPNCLSVISVSSVATGRQITV